MSGSLPNGNDCDANIDASSSMDVRIVNLNMKNAPGKRFAGHSDA